MAPITKCWGLFGNVWSDTIKQFTALEDIQMNIENNEKLMKYVEKYNRYVKHINQRIDAVRIAIKVITYSLKMLWFFQ